MKPLPIAPLFVLGSIVLVTAANPSRSFAGSVDLMSLRPDPMVATVDDGTWFEVPPPTPRSSSSAVYDPVADRMIVMGGFDNEFRNDVWALPFDAPAWRRLVPTGALPTGRALHSMVYDSARQRVLLFGGKSSSVFFNDVWSLDLNGPPAWTPLATSGVPPTARITAAAIYDPVRDRMLVFGGAGAAPGFFNDVWELTLSGTPTWTQIFPGGSLPEERHHPTAIYDPVRDRMVMTGGNGTTPGAYFNDVWTLSLDPSPTWTELAPSGSPPPPRTNSVSIYDASNDRLVMFGGYTDVGSFNDAWALSLVYPAWDQILPSQTPVSERFNMTAIFDPVRTRMVVFGGEGAANKLSDTWALGFDSGPSWTMLAPGVSYAQSRGGHSGIYDPLRDRMLVFGGSFVGLHNDLWEFPLDGSSAWTEVPASATPPSPRRDHTAIYDPIRDRMIVFGGFNGTTRVNDTWELSLSGIPTWAPVAVAGMPPPEREDHTAIYDPIGDRMIVFGGTTGTTRLNDVWALSLDTNPTWTQLSPLGTPPSVRADACAVFDPDGGRMVVYGGSSQFDSDPGVWALSLSGTPTWSPITPAGTIPTARREHVMVHDPGRHRLIVHSGTGPFQPEVWALSLDASPTWTKLAPAGPPTPDRRGHAAIFDPVRDRMVVFSGGINPTNETWFLEFADLAAVPPGAVPTTVRLAPSYPNPARGGLTIPFTLALRGRATLSAFDLGGRRVRMVFQGDLPAGTHTMAWDGRSDRGAALSPGVYLVELRALGSRATRRVVIAP